MEEPPFGGALTGVGVDRGVGREPEVADTVLARGLEWFWRGKALAAARGRSAAAGTRERELERRARVAAQLAGQAYEPRERFIDGSATFLAAELYREAAYWALRALPALPANAAVGNPGAGALWASIDPELLETVAPDAPALEALRRSFVELDFVAFAELAEDEQARSVERLGAFTALLLERLDTTQRVVDALWLERLMHCGLVGLMLVLAAVVAVAVDRLGPDLASGKTWRASSDLGVPICHSPEQTCDDSPYYFFHTRAEHNPWIEIDLGAPSTFTKVRVENREECCYERAVPLVLEVSDDRKQWHQRAWRKQEFTSWTAQLPPTTARFVRLRVKGQGPLHLKAVRVLP